MVLKFLRDLILAKKSNHSALPFAPPVVLGFLWLKPAVAHPSGRPWVLGLGTVYPVGFPVLSRMALGALAPIPPEQGDGYLDFIDAILKCQGLLTIRILHTVGN